MTETQAKVQKGTDIILSEGASLIELYQKDDDGRAAIHDIIERIESEIKAEAFSAETPDGRTHIKSVAYKIAQSKSALDKAGKELGAEARKTLESINEDRRIARERLEKLQADVRKPLTQWEEEEEKRQAKVDSLLSLMDINSINHHMEPNEIRARIDEVARINPEDDFWRDQKHEAELAKKECLEKWPEILAAAEKRVEDALELDRLRKAEEERQAKEQVEREAREAREAQERAEAEARERQEREIAERRQRIKERLDVEFTLPDEMSADTSVSVLEGALEAKKAIPINDATWGDLMELAEARKEAAVSKIEGFLVGARAREDAEQERLERERLAAREEARQEADRANYERRSKIVSAISEALNSLGGDHFSIAEAIYDGKIPYVYIDGAKPEADK